MSASQLVGLIALAGAILYALLAVAVRLFTFLFRERLDRETKALPIELITGLEDRRSLVRHSRMTAVGGAGFLVAGLVNLFTRSLGGWLLTTGLIANGVALLDLARNLRLVARYESWGAMVPSIRKKIDSAS